MLEHIKFGIVYNLTDTQKVYYYKKSVLKKCNIELLFLEFPESKKIKMI